jgi:uncharacterized protein
MTRRPGAKTSSWSVAMLAIGPFLAATPGLAQVGLGGFDHEGLAKTALEAHIRPGFAALQAKADGLKSTLETACKKPDSKDADGVRAAFRDALLAWSHVEHLRFGPVIESNRFERMVFWPDRQKIGDRQVRKILSGRDPKALNRGDLYKKSVAVQGFTALEALLYGPAASKLLTAGPEGAFMCGYASAIAANIAAMSGDMVAAWTPDGAFTKLWLNPGEQNPIYKAANSTSFELLKAYKFGINNPREYKLLPALGLKRNGAGGEFLPPSKPPFELSGLALATIIANTEGVLALYEKGGFDEQLAQTEPETAKLIKSELGNVLTILRASAAAGNAAFVDPEAKKIALARQPFVSALLGGGEALANATGMVLGFQDDDGD